MSLSESFCKVFQKLILNCGNHCEIIISGSLLTTFKWAVFFKKMSGAQNQTVIQVKLSNHCTYFGFIECKPLCYSQSQLTYHIQRIHEEKRPYSCELCSKSFHKNSDLRQHRHVHMGIKKHVCPDCGRAFNHVSNLNRHQRTHVSRGDT